MSRGGAAPRGQQPVGGSSPGTRRRLSREERREQIWKTAEALVIRDGLQQLTHRGIASELGVTHALVAHYERDMDVFRARVCHVLLSKEFEQTREATEHMDNAVDCVRTLVELMSRPGRETLAALWLDGWSLGRRVQCTAEVMRDLMNRWQGLVAGVLARGIRDGHFAPVDVEACAWEAIALLDGLNAHMLVGYGDRAQYAERVAAPMEARLGLPHGTLTVPPAPTAEPAHHQ